MSWFNLPADDTTDWTDVVFQDQFLRAYFERLAVINPAALSFYYASSVASQIGWTRYFPRINGVITPTYIPLQPGDLTFFYGFKWLQQGLELICPQFARLDTGPPAGDMTSTIQTHDLSSWRAEAGLHPDGFQRRYPREFDHRSTYIPQGWSPADGQLARSTADGQVYRRAGGDWTVDATGAQPDVIEAFGLARGGDYVGSWLFNELYEGLQAMRAIPSVVYNLYSTAHSNFVYGNVHAPLQLAGGAGEERESGYANYAADIEAAKQYAIDDFRVRSNISVPEGSFYFRGATLQVIDARGSRTYKSRAYIISQFVKIGMRCLIDIPCRLQVWANPGLDSQYRGFGSGSYNDFGLGLTLDRFNLISDTTGLPGLHDELPNPEKPCVYSELIGSRDPPPWPDVPGEDLSSQHGLSFHGGFVLLLTPEFEY